MEAYSNIKAYRSVGLDIKGYKEAEASRGLAWSCKVYLHKKMLGLVSNNGDGGMTRVEIDYAQQTNLVAQLKACLLYTSPSPRDQRGSRMPSSA